MSAVYFDLASGSLIQNWDTNLITTDNDWSTVPHIVGYRGDDLTTATGTDPQTILAGTATPVNVEANETNPNTFGTGGVAEFQIANPTIALNGSGTADAPSIVIHLNAIGRTNINLTFNARDLDGSVDNAIQQIAVQYRIGETGSWTNLSAGYIADATTGPSLASLVTPISVTLPAAADNQPQLQVRIITANSVGNDEWVGIDDIVVASDPGPQSIRFAEDSLTVALSEGNSATTAFTFTVERIGATDGQVDFTVALTSAVADSADFSGAPALPLTINGMIPAGSGSTTITVNVSGDSAIEINENFTLTITDAVNSVSAPTAIDENFASAVGRILTDDFSGTDIGGIAILPQAESLQGDATTPVGTDAIQLVRLGSIAATDGNAEVVTFDPTSGQLYLLNALGAKIEIVSISSSALLSKVGEIDLSTLTEFGAANSVAVKNGIVAVAYANATAGDNGYVALFSATGVLQGAPIEVGVLPDMLTFTPDGTRILVANEGEALSNANNPNGSISIIELSGGALAATVQTTIGFTSLNGSEAALDGTLGFSMFPGQSAAADFEPEYISISPDGTRAYVTLQEVNAVAVIDLTNPAATLPLAILPLGSIDRSLSGNQFDPSDQDGIDIGNWPVQSLLQPDSIVSFTVNGVTYFATANEGDARVGTGLDSEEVRLSNSAYDLDNATFPNEATLKQNANLGRLNVINHEGDTDGDGDIDVITTYGGRGISIFRENEDGSIEKVRETGGEFERILSQESNASFFFNGENRFGTADSRSDNKGPEPEGIDVGVVGGRTYVFVTLERAGGVMTYDVTDPANASFVGYTPPLPPTTQPSPDNAPETIKFISAADSPTGTALVVTANEGGATASLGGRTTTVYAVVTPIYEIQGSGHASAYDGESVSTTGVVTAVDSNGFYIQAAIGDGNAATSDAVFVFTGSAPTVAVGLEVMVRGTVDEFVPNGAAPGFLPITQIVAQNSNVITLGIGAAITPVEIGGAGNLAPPTQDMAAGAAFWEALEGMLVKVNNPVSVGPTNGFGEVYTVVDNDDNAANGLNATGLTPRGTLQFTPGTPEPDDPGTTGTDSLTTTNTTGGDFNPERIQIDDDSGVLPGFVSPVTNPGAVLSDVVGVVSYNFANYEVIPTQPYTVVQASTLVKETTTLAGTADRLTVASYNAENLDANDPDARFTAIADEIVNRLSSPDVIALQEIQDDDGTVGGTGSTVTGAGLTLQKLVDALNAIAPAGVEYKFIDNPFIGDDSNGGQPGGNIRNAYLYREDRVDFVAGSLHTIGVDGVPIDTQAGALDQQVNPENPFFGSRPPLVATFEFNGHDVTVVNNHFSSKGGSGALFGSDLPPLNASEVQRAAQAQAVNNFVDSLLGIDADAKVIVAGDLNEFPTEEPMAVLRGDASISEYNVPGSDPFFATATYTPGGIAILSDLLETLPANEQYDYFFEGNVQTLDHILVTEGLTAGVQFDVVRINAEFSDQTSDHDPLLASFLLEAPVIPPYRLQILHASDFEAGLDAVDRAGNFAAIVDYLEETHANSITLSSGDNYLPSPFFAAGSDASLKEVYETALETHYNLAPGTLNIAPGFGTADIAMLNIIGVEASAIGNHEFDAGTNPFAAIIRQTERVVDPDGPGGPLPGVLTPSYPGAQFAYLSANINFAGDANLNPLFTNVIRNAEDYTGFPPAAGIGKKIAPAAIINENGERIGVVGATTQIVESISSTGGIDIIGDDVNDMPALAAILQPTIDALLAQGINKIILVSHLQQIALEKELAPLLHGVDIIISGGSNTLQADSEDVARGLRPGDTADETYPFTTQNADGKTTLIVNTDGEYSYVGRLVVDFDANGDIVASSVDANVSGAFATTDEAVDALYAQGGVDVDADGDIDADDANPFADGSRGDLVNDIAQGVGNVIDSQDGNLFGKTSVYLDGRRGEVRTEETNLGSLTADANLWYAQQLDSAVVVSIKNGGGIRDSIGRVEAVGGTAVELPPAANPGVGKQEGDVSQLDIANAVRFNNALSLVTLTPEQLLQVLEHAVSATAPGATPGQFAQIGGIAFSFDATRQAQVQSSVNGAVTTPGERILSVALVDESGEIVQTIVENGDVVAGAPAAIRVVTLSFLIDDPDGNGLGGDNYPFSRFIQQNPAFANRVDLDPDASGNDDVGSRTGVATFTDNGREQDALAEYMAAQYSVTPFAQADTAPAQDIRIQNLAFRSDTVLDNDAPIIIGDLVVTVNEGQTVVITTADLSEADPDHSGTLLTYTVTATIRGNVLVNGIVATSFTQADLAAGLVSFRHDGSGSPDASFTVTLQDSPGLISAPATVVVEVIGENDAPVFTSGPAFSIQENRTLVGTVAATDPDGDQFTFAIAGGADAAFFAIDPDSGALRFVNSPDFETREDAGGNNVYDVIVSATDPLGESGTQAISVSVTNVGEPGRTFNGGNGNQTFVGTTGNDDMNGGNGRDNLNGGDGNDDIDGGNDNDILVGGRGNDEIEGGNGNDSLDGGLGNDDLEGGNGRDILFGGAGNDDLEGGSDDDVMDGGTGNDDLEGGSGNDIMNGGDGNDDMDGDSGHDVLTGGAGNDRMSGDSGDDLFVFSAGFGRDVITDFRGDDRILFNDGLFDNFQELRAASQQVGGSVVITVDAGNTITLQQTNVNSLNASDFLFLS